jgi:hypothetical protein
MKKMMLVLASMVCLLSCNSLSESHVDPCFDKVWHSDCTTDEGTVGICVEGGCVDRKKWVEEAANQIINELGQLKSSKCPIGWQFDLLEMKCQPICENEAVRTCQLPVYWADVNAGEKQIPMPEMIQTCHNGSWGYCVVADEKNSCDSPLGGNFPGICSKGFLWGAKCLPIYSPDSKKEVCNGLDDDCDGEIDEALYNACLLCGPLSEEKCDNDFDDDCDGSLNEGCKCPDNEVRNCGIEIGECHSGTQVCNDNVWGECLGAVFSTEETMNGLDDDCDGVVDNCMVSADCAPGICVFNKCVVDEALTAYIIPPNKTVIWSGDNTETCDGVDNDLDGSVDEGCPCDMFPESLKKPKPCGGGFQKCKDGDWGECEKVQ